MTLPEASALSGMVRERFQGFDDFLDEIVGIGEFVGFFEAIVSKSRISTMLF
jgi:hypothetical protein